jgi:hypothetical protein
MPDARPVDDVGYYVYGVVPAQGEWGPALTGLDDTEVEYVALDDLAAAVGVVSLDRPPGRRAELVAHSRVVDALAARGPVVPVQFGSVLADRESVTDDLLESRYDHFVALLERLAGTAQFNLRATYIEEQVLAEAVRSNPRIAELRRRTRDLPPGTMHPDLVRLGEEVAHELESKRAEDTASILGPVLSHAIAHRERAGGGVDHLFDVALLVEQDRQARLEDELESLAEAVHERVRLRLTGPLAAYDFVEEAAWA